MQRSIMGVMGVVVLWGVAGCYSSEPKGVNPPVAQTPAAPQAKAPAAEPHTVFRSVQRPGHLEVVADHADVQLTLRLAGTTFETNPQNQSAFRIDGQEVWISIVDVTAPPGTTTEQILAAHQEWHLNEMAKQLQRQLGPAVTMEMKAPDGTLWRVFSVEVPPDLAEPGVARSAFAITRIGSHIVKLGSPLPAQWEPGMTKLLGMLSTLTSTPRK